MNGASSELQQSLLDFDVAAIICKFDLLYFI